MKFSRYFFPVVFSLFMVACGSSQKIEKASEWSEVSDPLATLNEEANQLIEAGAVAAVGEGRSTRRDIAKQKAMANAEMQTASIFERKVQALKKNFQEEVGQGDKSEVNELFSSVSKTVINKTLKGAVIKDYKILQNSKGEYLYGVLMVISPKTVNLSILDEMEANNPKLYQRFRASKAFEELQKEIQNYDK